MAPKWLRWLTYAHDPEAHETLASIRAKLDVVAAQVAASMPTRPSSPMRQTATLDCGHQAASWATNSDGVTECNDCYDWRVRQQAHDPIFSVIRIDDGWCVRGRTGYVAGPYSDQSIVESICKALNVMSNSTGRKV